MGISVMTAEKKTFSYSKNGGSRQPSRARPSGGQAQRGKGQERAKQKRPFRTEYSAGGLVVRDGKVLLVKVCNLQGVVVWTLPKGHLESGETSQQAALREVFEETGYRCRILSTLPTARYHFVHKGWLIRKQVRWYRMEAGEKAGQPDAQEVLSLRWASVDAARRLLRYPSDLQLIELAKR